MVFVNPCHLKNVRNGWEANREKIKKMPLKLMILPSCFFS